MIGFILLFFIAAVKSGVFGWNLFYLMSTFFVMMILPPALLLVWAVRTKRVSNWDLSNRKQRVRALLIFACFLCIDYFIVERIGTPLMSEVFRFVSMLFAGFFLITLRSKISGHMMTWTLIILFFISWYGWTLAPLFFIIPLLGWSRLVLKRHTLGEVMGGVLYPICIFFLARGLHLI